MASRGREVWDRRRFLWTATGLVAAAAETPRARADDKPPAASPRATSGDALEPRWEQRLTVTVGPRDADLVGKDDKVIQAAVDYVARLGGGTVRILPGTYRLRNAIHLQPKVRLLGSAADSILLKEPSVSCKLAAGADAWAQEVTLAEPKGFEVGDGVRVICIDLYSKRLNFAQRTLVARSGNRFKLDQPLRENFWLQGDARIATIFPLLRGVNVADCVIENLILDGNKANNELIDKGSYDDGSIRLTECNRITMRKVTSHDFNCDGIVW